MSDNTKINMRLTKAILGLELKDGESLGHDEVMISVFGFASTFPHAHNYIRFVLDVDIEYDLLCYKHFNISEFT